MIFICSIIKIIIYFIVGYVDLHAILFYTLLIVATISIIMENIICEYILVLQTKERNKHLEKKTEN